MKEMDKQYTETQVHIHPETGEKLIIVFNEDGVVKTKSLLKQMSPKVREKFIKVLMEIKEKE